MVIHRPRLHDCLIDKPCSAHFLADRTNGRAYATVLRLSVRLSVRL